MLDVAKGEVKNCCVPPVLYENVFSIFATSNIYVDFWTRFNCL